MAEKDGENPPALGATPDPAGGFRFRVWAPRARRVEVELVRTGRRLALEPTGRAGHFGGRDTDSRPGDRYWYRADGRRLPDPTSRYQPDGGDGPSAMVDLGEIGPLVTREGGFDLSRSVLYELHVGTFTEPGTFEAAVPHLAALARTGVTAVELLPVPEGGGERGWGYGGVHLFAVRRAYGGPAGLLRFVDAAHRTGLAVLLDVVYNHWGHGADFLERFGPYFHPRARTPWGPTPNFVAAGHEEVREYFFENARWWIAGFGIDGFRLDAFHEVHDRPSRRFWPEFSSVCREIGAPLGRRPVLIAESDLRDVSILRPEERGGWGIDAQWADDFHHALHAALTGERRGYYADFGALELLARVFERPFRFPGAYTESRDPAAGTADDAATAVQFVVFDQNHDQIGNRGDGARLTRLLPSDLARVALGLTLFSPYVPMLFMGEEYGEERPFYFFGDPPPLGRRRLAAGRRRHLRANGFEEAPPDPSDPATRAASSLDWAAADSDAGRARRGFVTELLRLRRELPSLARPGRTEALAFDRERWLAIRRTSGGSQAVMLVNLRDEAAAPPTLGWPGRWTVRFASGGIGTSPDALRLDGTGDPAPLAARSFVIGESVRPG